MALPRTVNRVLELATYDLDTKGKPTDAEIGKLWGITDRAVRSLRDTDEYREVIAHFQVLTIARVEDRVSKMQEEALNRLERLVPLLADRAFELLQAPAGHQQTDAANRAIKTLIELSNVKGGRKSAPTQELDSAQPLMPNLVIAHSETTIVKEHLAETVEAEYVDITK